MNLDCGIDGLTGAACAWHMVDRFFIHFGFGAGVALAALTAWTEVAERGWLWKLRGLSWFVFPPLVSCALIFIREPWDVAHGDPAVKSMIDGVSWLLGTGAACFGIYRLVPRAHEARAAIFRQRLAAERRRQS